MVPTSLSGVTESAIDGATFVVPPQVATAHGSEPAVPALQSPDANAAAATKDPVALHVDKCSIWGTEFARLDMPQTMALADQIIRRGVPEFFITANLNYLMLTEQHPRLAEVNARSIAVLADGNPIVRRSRATDRPLPCRVAGADMIVELARLSSERGYRMFFLGAAPGVAQKAADALRCQFPTLPMAGCYAPPFRPLTAAEHTQLLAMIRAARPDILLVAFGQPKGELWIYDNLRELGVPLSIQLGASFDFLAGTARRAPWLWQQMGCEWLYRALSHPQRLGPRYAANLRFLMQRKLADLSDSMAGCRPGLPRQSVAVSNTTRK